MGFIRSFISYRTHISKSKVENPLTPSFESKNFTPNGSLPINDEKIKGNGIYLRGQGLCKNVFGN